MSYISLVNYTEYSLKKGCMKVPTLIKEAKKRGMSSIGVTEIGNMFSAMEFYSKAIDIDKKNEKDYALNPLVGITAFYEENKYIHILCKNIEGYKNLIKVVTHSQLNKINEMPIINIEELDRDNLIILSGNSISSILLMKKELTDNIRDTKKMINYYQGLSKRAEKMTRLFSESDKKEIAKILKNSEFELERLNRDFEIIKNVSNESLYNDSLKKANYFKERFGSNFYIELQNHKTENELYSLPILVQLAEELDIEYVATQDTFYLKKEDKKAKDILNAIEQKITIKDSNFKKDSGEHYFKTEEEMLELFKDYPKAIENTEKIANSCNLKITKKKHFPKMNLPENETSDSYLRKLTIEGAKKKLTPLFLSKQEKKKYMDRIDYELGVINKLGFDEYLLIVSDFCSYGRKVGMVGPGRGSAVGSLVSYLIDITDVDPMPYNLFFERFLNEERVSDPDVDSDFCNSRELVIDYCKKVYGEEKIAQIITYGTMSARKAIRDVGRATGKSLGLCDRIAKLIPAKPGVTISKALGEELNKNNEIYEEFYSKDLVLLYKTDSEVEELINDTLLVEGLKVQTGIHAAGVIIADEDLSNLVPLYYDDKENKWIVQYDKDICEKVCGLLKMDFLGLENLTIMKRTRIDVLRNKGIDVDVNAINLNDEVLYKEIFQKGKTKGVFQFESPGMRQLLKRFKPTKIEDLILLNAVYRPGPMQYIDEIIAVKNGEKEPEYIVPELKDICDLTYGKPVYQEQIMQIFNIIGGFSLGTADIIRRAMSKKHMDELENYFPDFKKALIKKGATEEQADKFCNELIEFARYAFNKSHSTAYAVVAVYTAFFKHYYPVEYMANLLYSAKETNDIASIIHEVHLMGIKIEHPDINLGYERFFPTKEGVIYYGLEKIKNVGKASNIIVPERQKNGDYLSIIDMIDRVLNVDSKALNKRVVESLIYSGAFDKINQGMNKKQMVDGIGNYIEDKKNLVKISSEMDIYKTSKEEILSSINIKDIDLSDDFTDSFKNLIKKIETAKTEKTKLSAINTIKSFEQIKKIQINNDYISQYLDCIDSSPDVLELYKEVYDNIKEINRLKKLINSREEKLSTIDEKEYFQVVTEFNKNDLLAKEMTLLGYFYSGHPLDLYKNIIDNENSTLICDINSDMKDKIKVIGRITNIKKINRKSDNADMCMFDLEDSTGIISTITFTKQYQQLKNFYTVANIENLNNKIVRLEATVLVKESDFEEDEELQLCIENISEISKENLYIKIPSEQIKTVKSISNSYNGSSSVYVFNTTDNKLYKLNDIFVDIQRVKKELEALNIEYNVK